LHKFQNLQLEMLWVLAREIYTNWKNKSEPKQDQTSAGESKIEIDQGMGVEGSHLTASEGGENGLENIKHCGEGRKELQHGGSDLGKQETFFEKEDGYSLPPTIK